MTGTAEILTLGDTAPSPWWDTEVWVEGSGGTRADGAVAKTGTDMSLFDNAAGFANDNIILCILAMASSSAVEVIVLSGITLSVT